MPNRDSAASMNDSVRPSGECVHANGVAKIVASSAGETPGAALDHALQAAATHISGDIAT